MRWYYAYAAEISKGSSGMICQKSSYENLVKTSRYQSRFIRRDKNEQVARQVSWGKPAQHQFLHPEELVM